MGSVSEKVSPLAILRPMSVRMTLLWSLTLRCWMS